MKKIYFLTLLGYASTFFAQVTVPPYTQEFTTFPLTNWYLGYAFNANIGNGPTNTSTSYWQQKPFLGNTTVNDQSLCINLFTANVSAWAITNAFDLSGGDYEISFDYATANGPFMTNPNGPAPQVVSTDKFKVLITTDNGITWQELKNWDNPNMTISNERNSITLDVSAYKGNNVKFAFYTSDGATFVAAANYRIFVDNFKVQLKQIIAVSDINKTIFQVYPNPTADKVSVKTDKVIKSLELYDSTGKKLQSTTSKEMDLSRNLKGIYLIKIIFADSTTVTEKVVKL